MPEQRFLIGNRLGLHARAAAKLVQTLSAFSAEATIEAGSRRVNGKSIMGVMLLAAAPGSEIRVRTDGADAELALAAVADLIGRHFDEEPM
ncbi:MAG TPA: phosphocarrier protein HPr [Xanthomonadales bacterium]|nr:phosphocarrier protein HPr [Xanthomonadales bacterium]